MLVEFIEVFFGRSASKNTTTEVNPGHAVCSSESQSSSASDEEESMTGDSEIVKEEDFMNKAVKAVKKMNHAVSELTVITKDSVRTTSEVSASDKSKPEAELKPEEEAQEETPLESIAAPPAEEVALSEPPSEARPKDKKTEDCLRQLHMRDLFMKEKMEKKVKAHQEREKKRSKKLMQTFIKKYLADDDNKTTSSKSTSITTCSSSQDSTSVSDLTRGSRDKALGKTARDSKQIRFDLPRQRENSRTGFAAKLHQIMDASSKKKQNVDSTKGRRQSFRMKVGASLSKKMIVGQCSF